MYECVKAGVDVVLAGSIRDDGPLPEVITDTLVAQDRMRQAIHGVGFALLIATALAFDRDRQPAAGVGEGGLRRYQPGDRDQARRSRHVPDDRPGDRRRAVSALACRRAGRRSRATASAPVDVVVIASDARHPLGRHA